MKQGHNLAEDALVNVASCPCCASPHQLVVMKAQELSRICSPTAGMVRLFEFKMTSRSFQDGLPSTGWNTDQTVKLEARSVWLMSIIYTPSLSNSVKNDLTGATNQLDEEDLLDPSPDIHFLFVQFSVQYFNNKLGSVDLKWSKRMTACAGVCQYRPECGMCTIRLSEPLLKFRPRSDLVNTLLHEMIHAYLFVTHNWTDRAEHGPEFHRHMHRINTAAGTRITVYHNFFDEVDLYRKHIWRCNGSCRNQAPYFGFLKRATNRAPGPRDPWFSKHAARCGGQFIKESEPEGYKSKRKQSADSPFCLEKPAKIKTINGAINQTAPGTLVSFEFHILDFKPGVNWSDVVPFTSSGYVLGSGAKVEYTDRTPLAEKQLQSRNNTDSSAAKKLKLANNGTKQTTIDSHFSPSAASPSIIKEVCTGNRQYSKVGGSQTRDCIDITESDNLDADFDRELDEFLMLDNEFVDNESAAEDSGVVSAVKSGTSSHVACPICAIEISLEAINSHLDACLN